jgi:hypothetical protein
LQLEGSGFSTEIRLGGQDGCRDDKPNDFERMVQFHGKQAGADHGSKFFDASL